MTTFTCKNILLAIVYLAFTNIALAQNTLVYSAHEQDYNKGLELIQSKKYNAARAVFEKYVSINPSGNKSIEAQYYIAFSSLQLFNPDAEMLFEKFVTQHPTHSKSQLAYYDLGSFYYQQKNYDKTITYLEKANLDQQEETVRMEGKFRLGYAHFAKKEFDAALPFFNAIKNQKHQYTATSNYYAAYIEFKNQEYDNALSDLSKIENDEAYKNLASIMIASIYYKRKEDDKVIAYCEKILGDKKSSGNEELYLLLAESYYNKKNYKSALDNYAKYTNDFKTKPSSEVQYRIGYSAYKNKDYETAIKNFKNVAAVKDSSGQAGAYLLGVSYMQVGNKEYAFAAFDQARKTDYNNNLQKEATFSYAKLCLDLEKYNEGVAILKDYIKLYPNDNHEDEAQELLSESLVNSSNPTEALAYFATIKKQTPRIKAALQKVALNKGIELFNANKFKESIAMFDKSFDAYTDANAKLAATFWKGEALSVEKDYAAAINCYAYVFQHSTKESEYHFKARYGIGYAYYNTQQYEKALPHFKAFVVNFQDAKVKPNYNDALVRYADLLYATKQYQEAVKTYDEIIALKTTDIDYAYFQKGLISGINGNYPTAIKSLEMVITKFPYSLYYVNALFQKADFELENSNYQQAILDFTALIIKQPNSGYIPYAYLKRAIAYSNLNQHTQAVADYKLILDKYPAHPAAQNAVLGLPESMAASGKTENMEEVLGKFKEANPQSHALVKIEFENAKNYYNNQDYPQAIKLLNAYKVAHPDNANMQELDYYLAESYYRTKDTINAIGAFNSVYKDISSPYYNKAVMRLAELEYDSKSYQISKTYYKILMTNARNKKERSTAWIGLLENHYALQEYDSASAYTKEILTNGNSTVNAESKALLYTGKIALAKNDTDKATDAFINTINNAKDEYGAEAQYLMGKMLYDQKKYKQSLETLYDLNNNFAAYTNWVSKAFLLIADNFIQLKEIFQATATLNSIIEKSPDAETVRKAKLKLKEITPVEVLEDSTSTSNNQ